ncbi:methyltetrahydroprotoberberine 14-monooxygenase-like [Juglans regia]|uniref:Methyltetrahydroprotoberberine 14-monooxygenase-like n=1 Tax=Juglans regia TaxID=51240 RepID=A0A6P9E1M6_JUGRE|nr:methyltetrahydroprotoberberine 14-monooxygenase-like [Juglans regia]
MEIISYLLAIAGVLVLVLLYNLWRVTVSHHTKGKLAPEPSGSLPIIGHLHQLHTRNTIVRTLVAMADKHGPIFMLRFGMKRTLVISSHEAVKECFTTNDRIFATRPMSIRGKYLGYNYAGFGFYTYGPYWSKIRKLAVSKLLSSRRLETLKNMQGQVKSMKRVAGELDSLIGSWVEEHTARRLKSDEQNHKPDFIDVMISLIEEDSMFGHTRETIVKATAMLIRSAKITCVHKFCTMGPYKLSMLTAVGGWD